MLSIEPSGTNLHKKFKQNSNVFIQENAFQNHHQNPDSFVNVYVVQDSNGSMIVLQ